MINHSGLENGFKTYSRMKNSGNIAFVFSHGSCDTEVLLGVKHRNLTRG